MAQIKDAKLIEYARALTDAYGVIVATRSRTADHSTASELALRIAALAPDLEAQMLGSRAPGHVARLRRNVAAQQDDG